MTFEAFIGFVILCLLVVFTPTIVHLLIELWSWSWNLV